MGINRYEHIPQYNPPILPYDLVMKAADMKQQRWDKAVGTAQENFNDVFSKAKAISGSVDERVHLPAIREEFNNELSKLVSDPSMTAEQLSVRANGLVNRIQPRLNKYNDAYTLHTTALTEKMKNEGNATWSATNEYVSGPDTYNWDSEKNTDYSQLNYKSRTSLEPVIKPLIDDWEKTQLQTREVVGADGKTSTITVDGRDFAGLQNLGKTQALGLMTLPVFAQWQGDYKGIRPDDILKDTPGFVQTFGGKKFEELSNMDQAKAMIMFRGAKQLTMDSSKLAGPSGNPKGPGADSDKVVEPFAVFKKSKSVSIKEIVSSVGLDMSQWDDRLHAFTGVSIDPKATFNSPATIAEYSSPEMGVTASIYESIANTNSSLGRSLKALGELRKTPGYKPEVMFGDIVGNVTSGLTPGKFATAVAGDAAKRSTDLHKGEASILADIKSQLSQFKEDPSFLAVQREALKAGIDISTTEGLTKLVTDYDKAQMDLAKNQTVQLGKNLIGMSSATWQPFVGADNTYNIGDRKFIKGKIMIPATEEGYTTIQNALEAAGNTDIGAYDQRLDVGAIWPSWAYESNEINRVVERMKAAGILDIEPIVVNTKGDEQKYITIPTSIEVPMNNPATVSRYNRDMAGSDALLGKNLGPWEQNYAANRAQENLDELTTRIVDNPKLATNFVTGINNFILNTNSIDKDIRTSASQAFSTLVNAYTQHPNKETAKDLVTFQQALENYAGGRLYSKDTFKALLDGTTTSNPYQPQGATTSNSMGIRRKR